MSAEDIACCLSCHMTFGSHEELFVHTCAQIKVEVVEAEDTKQLNSIVQEDFRNEIDPIKVSENDSDYRPKKKETEENQYKEKRNQTAEKWGEINDQGGKEKEGTSEKGKI